MTGAYNAGLGRSFFRRVSGGRKSLDGDGPGEMEMPEVPEGTRLSDMLPAEVKAQLKEMAKRLFARSFAGGQEGADEAGEQNGGNAEQPSAGPAAAPKEEEDDEEVPIEQPGVEIEEEALSELAIAYVKRVTKGAAVVTRPEGRTDRALAASRGFQPGDVVFEEEALLHTSHAAARRWQPPPRLADYIPADWQRLLFEFLTLAADFIPDAAAPAPSPPAAGAPPSGEAGGLGSRDRLELLGLLSSAGVASPVAKRVDPQRMQDFRRGAVFLHEFLEALQSRGREPPAKKRKKARLSGRPSGGGAADDAALASDAMAAAAQGLRALPCCSETERLLQILDTNCHSRPAGIQGLMQGSRLAHDGEGGDGSAGEGLEEEEEVGLWFVGSMMEHSCRPNATVVLRGSRLQLRAIRPIQAGQLVTISYIDKELFPTSDRREYLLPKGFECACELCAPAEPESEGALRDVSRAFPCAACERGILCPAGDGLEPSGWRCLDCGAGVDRSRASAFATAEDRAASNIQAIAEQIPTLLEIVEEGLKADALAPVERPRAFLDALQLAAARCKPLKKALGPLHVAHASMYRLVATFLFEDTDAFRENFGAEAPLLACHYLAAVAGALAPALGIPFSEDLRQHLFSIGRGAKEAGQPALARAALERCRALCGVLYGEGYEWTEACDRELEGLKGH